MSWQTSDAEVTFKGCSQLMPCKVQLRVWRNQSYLLKGGLDGVSFKDN